MNSLRNACLWLATETQNQHVYKQQKTAWENGTEEVLLNSILITNEVYQGYIQVESDTTKIKRWTTQPLTIPDYSGTIYGSSVIFAAANEIKQ